MTLTNDHYRRQRKNGRNFKVLPNDDTLVLTVYHHVSVHVICQSVDVRRILILSLREDKRLN